MADNPQKDSKKEEIKSQEIEIDDAAEKQKVTKRKNILKSLLDKLYRGEKSHNKIIDKAISFIKVFIVSTRKFTADDCLTKASSIAYTLIISLVPTLTVILTFLYRKPSDQKALFIKISRFMAENNIKMNLDPVFKVLAELIANAGKISGIGAIVMIFTATAMLRSMEGSLNNIFRVQKSRPFFLKIVYYWTALTLGPIMLIAGTGVAAKVSDIFSAPDYHQAYLTKTGKAWVVGDGGSILFSKKNILKLKKIKTKNIDFDNQKILKYDFNEKAFNKNLTLRLEPSEINKMNYRDIQFIGKQGWIIGDEGILLKTTDRGETWHIHKFDDFKFNDIHMTSRRRGFATTDNGLLFKTKDGAENWTISNWEDITSFTKIKFYNNQGIITGNNGYILRSNDYGNNWEKEQINSAKYRDRWVTLNNVFFISENTIWLVGSDGTILLSIDGGKKWKSKRFSETNYYTAIFLNKKTGFVAGNKGEIIFTEDMGKKWKRKLIASSRINKLYFKDKTLYSIGDTGLIMISTDMGKTWKGKEGKSIIALAINFFAPFIFIWLFFLLMYTSLPNLKVPFKYASLGAAFTGVVWVIFILAFKVYVQSFAKGQFAIYGTLASIPLSLLLVYASATIILYGAEVSFTLMHPKSYGNIKRQAKQQFNIYIFDGISILHYIYKKFESGKGPTGLREILVITLNNTEEANYLLKTFIDNNVISAKDDNTYIPANSSQNLKLAEVISFIDLISFTIPAGSKTSALKTYVKDLFNDINKSNDKIIGEITLKDVIEKC
ncbi:YhjD/YihY/BrkB family envelope integrity protein [Spirochaetota bacterium]